MTKSLFSTEAVASHPVLVQGVGQHDDRHVSFLDALDTSYVPGQGGWWPACAWGLRLLAAALALGCAAFMLIVLTRGGTPSTPTVHDGTDAVASIGSEQVPAQRLVQPTASAFAAQAARIEDERSRTQTSAMRESELPVVQEGMVSAGQPAASLDEVRRERVERPHKRAQNGAAKVKAMPEKYDPSPDRDVDIIEVIVGSGKAER